MKPNFTSIPLLLLLLLLLCQMILSLSHSPSISFHFKTLACNSPPPQLPPPPPKSAVRFKNPNTKPLKPHLRRTSHPNAEAVAKSAIKRISDKLRSLGYLQPDDDPSTAEDHRPHTGPGSPGEIFIPTPQAIPKNRVGCTLDPSWSTPEHPVPEPGSGAGITQLHGLWRREKEIAASERVAGKAESAPTVAELTIPPADLKRLRSEGIRLDKRLKVGKAGITEGIVNGIHERWRRSEVVKLKCEDLCRINMKRTHEILERKTGGLVVWRSGSVIILYRGANYKYPYFHKDERTQNYDEASSNLINDDTTTEANLLMLSGNPSAESSHTKAPSSLVVGVGSPTKVRPKLEGETQLEQEADRLLDGLGPRFTDWWGCDPLPVDADALPARVPDFRKPFRLLPFGIEPKLTDREMTILRRLSRPLPCHFVLGRNRNHQGLAMSMIKLWEKCEIAKIAVKRGVQNTSSEIMAEELKHLTGGTILSRDKDFIVFYRGKDYLPSSVSNAIEMRRSSLFNQQKQNKEKTCPLDATENIDSKLPVIVPLEPENKLKQNKLTAPDKRATSEKTLLSLENKLFQAMEKKKEAEKLLEEIEEKSVPTEELDKEAISEEERYMLRKVGLRMQPFLLLGRRGVFDGTIENMHLHWKYRELVKIISKDRCIENVESAARILEAESGGILVAVERVSKGHAIIVYRGKNYKRPATLRPTTLLNKKEAMKRSLEAQRRESLKLNVLNISRKIERIKNQMARVLSKDDMTIKTEKSDISEASDENLSTSEETGDSAEFKEVHQSDLESSHLEVYNDHMPKENNDVTPKSLQVELEYSKHNVKLFDSNLEQPFLDQSRVFLLDSDKNCASDESHSHPHISVKEAASSSSVNNMDKCFEDGEMRSVVKEDRDDSSSDKAKLEDESLVDFNSRAAPLSNRERLILRKQALKTRKRPVLSVGRNNVISGVAKTIKTHFKKHPLAIVNIKGRAEGTSVQDLIFQLEQATGAVLVSRELNKVILYRGWGAGETPGGKKGNELKASYRFNKVTSSRLLEAMRLECGLQPDLKIEDEPMA